MLDGILGRGFSSKCKSLMKVIKSRIDVIKRKKSATLKFLKKDIADLLANGLDINAYGRVEGYVAELMLSSCYEFVEKCCDFVSKHASVMQKLRDCPEDCREAVSSLMFAAARFSDLPELRDLRQIFHERYGNSLELFVNKQLLENSTSNPSSIEKKIKVMHDIASEFSIKWDSEGFERRMSKPTAPKEQPKSYGSFHINGGQIADPRGDKPKVSSTDKLEVSKDGHRLQHYKDENDSKRNELLFPSKQESSVEEFKRPRGGEEVLPRKENHDVCLRQEHEVAAGKLESSNGKDDLTLKSARISSSSHGKGMERVHSEARLKNGRENRVPSVQNQDVLLQGKHGPQLKSHDKDLIVADNYAREFHIQNPRRKAHGEKPYLNCGVPPPYVKPISKPKDLNRIASIGSTKAPSVNRTDNYQERLHHPDIEGQLIPPTMVNGHDHDREYYCNHNGSDAPIPRRRSSRRPHMKSPSVQDECNNVEDTEIARRRPRSRRDDSRRGPQIFFDDEQRKNDEERIIDKLLMHYSKKPSFEEGKIKRSKNRHAHVYQVGSGAGEAKASRGRIYDISETIPRPNRSISLPREQTAQPETHKVYARATSFQQDRLSAARHVHPKLPNYDDLAAQFAAMKGK